MQSVDRVLEELQEQGHTSSLALMQAANLPPVLSTVPPTTVGFDPEAEAWAFVRNATDPQDVTDFLAAYPASRFASAARLRSQQLQQQHRTVFPLPAPAETTPSRATETPERISAPDALAVSPTQIRQVQTRLREAGFAPGPIDGLLGPRTAAALRQ